MQAAMFRRRAALRLAFALSVALAPSTALVGQGPAPGFRLFGQMVGNETYLVDTNGVAVHTWTSSFRPGIGVYLLPDGSLLRTLNTRVVFGTTGGAGGGVQRIALDGTVLWDYRYDTPTAISHHDIEPLPNGNVLMIAWEDKTPAEAIAAGRDPALISGTVFRPDHIIEVMPTGATSGDIVWEWHAFDHLIQDFDPSAANFGVVADHPRVD